MRVLVATDLSQAGDIALQQGAELSNSPGDVLAVVHVIPEMTSKGFFTAHDEIREPRRQQVVDRAASAMHDYVARFAPRETEVFVDEGVDYASIVRRAENWGADVVVVGSHGRSGLSRVVGEVASKVIRNAHCSVLVSRATTSRGHVLVGIDFSDPSLAALSAAAIEARRRKAKLKLVHSVAFPDSETFYVLQLGTPAISRQAPERGRLLSMMRDALAKIGVDAECELLDPPAPSAIVRDAETVGAELVVVGIHGRTGLARLSMGGVAEKVVRASHCSVLVVRPVQK